MTTPDFTGKIVIITGASTGIGRAAAIAFANAGARVALAARSADELTQLAAQLGGPDRAIAIPTDVSDLDQCQHLIDETVAHFGGVDVLVNNAGMIVSGLFENLLPGDVERQFQVNFLAPPIAPGRRCPISRPAAESSSTSPPWPGSSVRLPPRFTARPRRR